MKNHPNEGLSSKETPLKKRVLFFDFPHINAIIIRLKEIETILKNSYRGSVLSNSVENACRKYRYKLEETRLKQQGKCCCKVLKTTRSLKGSLEKESERKMHGEDAPYLPTIQEQLAISDTTHIKAIHYDWLGRKIITIQTPGYYEKAATLLKK
jgi:hypothetical protein